MDTMVYNYLYTIAMYTSTYMFIVNHKSTVDTNCMVLKA